ncbi:putative sporulation protein [Paratrimastix pyriformis]|uniref:Sporulation protein n=1 Tax=Paratrimastix pyriformis TaxID=342808 RepID=A0ABQ8UD00_9EUKA|nr:putative sporulation protein [Paratrimastix pyriformis]
MSESPTVWISMEQCPEAAEHILDAQADGHPCTCTLDRDNADARRRVALHHTPPLPGYDRDEYPPAVCEEGGEGANVRYIDPHDNRVAGSSMAHQIKKYPNGTKTQIKVARKGR